MSETETTRTRDVCPVCQEPAPTRHEQLPCADDGHDDCPYDDGEGAGADGK